MTARERAEKLAAFLLTDGVGQRAVRLVLVDDQKNDLGGWGFHPLVYQIEQAIQVAIEEERERHAKLLNAYARSKINAGLIDQGLLLNEMANLIRVCGEKK